MNLRQACEGIVRRHAEAEDRHDVEATLATVYTARYEVAPLGVSDGETAVRDVLHSMITGFPDWHIEPGPLRHGDDFVFVEVRMIGTHNGLWAGWEPTGRKMDIQVACVFEFVDDRLVCEKVYFDFATVMRQLGKLQPVVSDTTQGASRSIPGSRPLSIRAIDTYIMPAEGAPCPAPQLR